jgi:hypothetical protein
MFIVVKQSFAPEAKAEVKAKKDAKVQKKGAKAKLSPTDGQTDFWDRVEDALLKNHRDFGTNYVLEGWIEYVAPTGCLGPVLTSPLSSRYNTHLVHEDRQRWTGARLEQAALAPAMMDGPAIHRPESPMDA